MSQAIKHAIRLLSEARPLSAGEAREAVLDMIEGRAGEALMAAFLMGLRVKGESEEELLGCVQAMRSAGRAITPSRRPLLDTCGTGGDGRSTFNISTTVAVVAAGAGATVAKHGNRSVSSQSGSADLLEALGVPLLQEPDLVRRCIEEVGLGFLFAPYFHPAIGSVAPVRRQLGVRTVFNLLGPLSNPARAESQLIGVYAERWCVPVARVAAELGVTSCLVVHGPGGLDELGLEGPSLLVRQTGGKVETLRLNPAELGLSAASPEALLGGSPEENAAITKAILEGESGPRREVVLLNTAAALWAGRLVEDMREGLVRAGQAIDAGAARTRLEELRAFSRKALA
ncbi:anthranilate phosphoribosyltransferase [bacterium CPR1]|nr:anthranilate phosphoribosyltransferase [bacterium CPR1]